MKHSLVFLLITILLTGNAFSQNQHIGSAGDLTSVNGIIQTLYDVISGPAGKGRNWNLFQSLFDKNARMYIAVKDKDSNSSLKTITPEEYAARNKTRLSDIGFNENELYRITNTYGAGTQISSTYQSHFTNKNGEQEITRGINNIQLYFDGKRYFIVSIFWDANAKNIEVPDHYLPKDEHAEYQINL